MDETFLSVGIDIGTSTTQLVFSRLRLKNLASLASAPRIRIVDKEVVFASGIHQTPLVSASEIDGPRVRVLIEEEYDRAGIRPDQVGTGAVIITGETARKANAAQVLATLAGLAGDFVVATAGPALEGIIAGKGAGAHTLSKERGLVVANLDIGGGTTNIAVFQGGEVIDTCCLDIGGRLVRVADAPRAVEYLSPKAGLLADRQGLALAVGQRVGPSDLEPLAAAMVAILEQAMGLTPATALLAEMATDKVLRHDYAIDAITFSGGVAECMDQERRGHLPDPFAFGDLGIILARALAGSALQSRFRVLEASETIRATVVGAGSHTTSISGSTVTFSDRVLPVRNVPVLKLSPADEASPLADWDRIIGQKVAWFMANGEMQMPALAFRGPVSPSFTEIQVMAQAIVSGLDPVVALPAPVMVVVENDLAKALGQALRATLGGRKEVICIDAIVVDNGDYIDIGKGIANGNVVPVIVKTLILGY